VRDHLLADEPDRRERIWAERAAEADLRDSGLGDPLDRRDDLTRRPGDREDSISSVTAASACS
jgi:hypothetical protein